MPEVDTIHQAQLDQFQIDLIEAGFDSVDGGRTWVGPLDPELRQLTTATTMEVRLQDGWPYRHPGVLVEGLKPSVHLARTTLCLWDLGDNSLAWLRFADLHIRIAQWATRYRGEATTDDPILDPHRYWVPFDSSIMATVDLRGIKYGDGGSGELRAEIKDKTLVIGEKGLLRVRWYGRDGMRHPPTSLESLAGALKKSQAANLQKELARVGEGGPDILLVVWDTPAGEPNVLVLGLGRNEAGEVGADAYEVARTDPTVLLKRSGPDAASLADKRVVIFGQGAIGSHLADLLARCGVGHLRLVDGQRLRPGDVIRHAALAASAGSAKADAMSILMRFNRRPTEVEDVAETPWRPTRLRELIKGTDLVIDAVGESSFNGQISRLAEASAQPLVAIALYRHGSIARSRLAIAGHVPIHARSGPTYPEIPPDPNEEPVVWETGCAAPVNNASPAAVVGAAAFAARLAIGVLVGRETADVDVVEVFEPIEIAPFDCEGVMRFGA